MELAAECLSKASQFSKFLEEVKLSFQTDPSNVCFKWVSQTDVKTGQRTIDQKVKDYAHSLRG